MQDRITKQKIQKYRELTTKALGMARKSIIKGRENYAREILEMVSNYLSDSKYFEDKGDFVSSFAALNYAHGWLDSGVRLDIFRVKSNKFFTVK
jgi:hypothetical protein